ncbi:hypothetical protein [Falsiroseomonas oryzae]|uniref:hypothetical protein n=1 Tax=Falsiroseomonas oryzae TaxID=2766473 RepID=UPI0022EA46C6|nr:hypothetical protein [Roseomonas sp. MO-31]
MSIRGSIDSLTPEGAVGWAFDGRDGEQLVVQALCGGRIIGEAVADRHRHDLAEAGFGDGCCGFEIGFYEPVDPALLPFVSVRPRGGDVEFPRYAATGFADFFRSLHARHPAAGRHRSVFGGLWTDRTDARRLLAGRIAAGSVPAELAASLGALIEGGHVVLRNVLPTGGLTQAEHDALARYEPGQPITAEGEGRATLAVLAELLFRDATVRPLRAALDDNPVCTRVVPLRGIERGFRQGSTAEELPSPAECLVMVAAAGGEVALDIVRDSHALPEFTPDGRSRWLAAPDAALELAVEQGLSLDHVELSPTDVAIVGPGTLHRLRAEGGATALRAWVLPRRVTPSRFLVGNAGTFALRHPTGAMLAA